MKKTSRTYRIVVAYGVTKKLCKHFGVCDETIRRALSYTSQDNELHKKIRHEAVKFYGGQEIVVEKPIK